MTNLSLQAKSDDMTLWDAHLGMAAQIVREHCYLKEHREDALQEVRLGLWEAVLNRSEALDLAFSYYAWVVMRRRLFHYLSRKAIDRPKLSRSEVAAMTTVRERLRSGLVLTSSAIDMLASEVSLSRFRLTQLLCVWHQSQMSITAQALTQFDEASSQDEVIQDEDALLRLDQAFHGLSDREAFIVRSRYLQDPKRTLLDLAEVFGVSSVRIKQIEEAALKKLRAALELKV